MVMANTLVSIVNTLFQKPEEKIHVDLLTSNSQELLMRVETLFNNNRAFKAQQYMEDENLSLDCVVGLIFSWGHSAPIIKWREEFGAGLQSALADPLLGYSEFFIKSAEYPLLLTNRHLWLNTKKNGDRDWHCPLFIRIRPIQDKNKRKRTAEQAAARWKAWQSKSWQKWQSAEENQPSSSARPSQPASSSSSWTPSVPWRSARNSEWKQK